MAASSGFDFPKGSLSSLAFRMKRVLLTGATGFIGRHCLRPLAEQGYEVHAVSRVCAMKAEDGTRWHRADLLDSRQIGELLASVSPTHLVHLAWYADPRDYRTSPLNLLWCRAGIELVRRFAEAGGQRAVFAGTCFEYDPRFGYCSENVTPEAPSTLYGVCKNSLRQILTKYGADTGMSMAWARIFYLFGPHEPPGRIVPYVIRSLLCGERAKCTHGRQLRDFLHVEDVASALAAVLDSDVEGAVNIGSDEPVSIRALVEKIARQLDAFDRVDFGVRQAAPTDAPVVIADVRRLCNEVGWRPRWSLDDGLADTIRWWKENQERPLG
jgi:nucleoside-diphosphate-sugar epimerase